MLTRAAIAVTACLAILGAVLAHSGCIIYLNPQCNDSIRNGDETDVDCGGTCGVCDIGDRCAVDRDCDEGLCQGKVCVPLPCANGAKDAGETDVDCGGGTCRKCAGLRGCAVDADCFSGSCGPDGTCAGLASVSFADAVPYPSGSKTYALFTGDIDNDGDLDIVAANEQDSNLTVLLNTDTSGDFVTIATRFPTGVYPTGGALADFDGDGLLDVITADYRGDSVSVLRGLGAGAFAPKTTYPTVPGAETSNLAVGDLNGDALLDVIATNPQSSSVSQFMGLPDGTLAPAIDVPVGIAGGAEPYSAAIGDFDRNGTNDVAIADNRGGVIHVKLGNGDGTFSPGPSPLAVGGLPSYIMIARDMDADGNLDLVCANRSSDNVSVFLGRGDGTFRKAAVSSTGAGTGPYSVAVADFNLDGVPDVVTANFKSSSISVLLGLGDGRFEPPIQSGPTGEVSYGVVAGDFNGDGKPDVATANANTNNVTVKLNTAR